MQYSDELDNIFFISKLEDIAPNPLTPSFGDAFTGTPWSDIAQGTIYGLEIKLPSEHIQLVDQIPG